MIYHQLAHRLLLQLDPEKAHQLVVKILANYPNKFYNLPKFNKKNHVKAFGIEFPHAVGLAAGFDKNAECYNPLLAYGFSHIEVGTITPLAQAGNHKPRLFRLKKDNALINRLGFNNKGIDYLVEQLVNNKPRGIVGVNIGKNKKTSLNHALYDYLHCQEKAHQYANYITINISSPNTPNLRRLFESNYLSNLLKNLSINQKKLNDINQNKVPLLLKLSPDLEPIDLYRVIKEALKYKIDGLIATNTTIQRPRTLSITKEEQGGLSGQPLQQISLKTIKSIQNLTEGKIDLIACGGINSSESAQACLNAGAKLLQIYTGFIYQGPGIINKIIDSIKLN